MSHTDLDPAVIAEVLRDGLWYLVKDREDAKLLSDCGFPTICHDEVETIIPSTVQQIDRLVVIQRPGEDGTAYGVAIKQRLTQLHWHKSLTRVPLPSDYHSLQIVKREVGDEKFPVYIAQLALDGLTEDVKPDATTNRSTRQPVRRGKKVKDLLAKRFAPVQGVRKG
jgi:hypothetical protein